MVMNEQESKKNHQFQVRYMLNPGLNVNKAFREQVESNMSLTFISESRLPIRIVFKKILMLFQF